MDKQIKQWILGSPETCAKELKWQLMDMGIYLQESAIIKVVELRYNLKCKCPDDSGSCVACLELQELR